MDKREEQLAEFNRYFSEEYLNYRKKLKQWCFLNHIDYIEDEINNTYLKIVEKILKDGIKAESKQDYLNYFFQSYKFNTYQNHLQKTKKKIDENINYEDVNIEDETYEETRYLFADFCNKVLEIEVKNHFSQLEYAIWRLRYLVTINGKTLNYKEVKQLTGVSNTHQIISTINNWIRENYSHSKLKEMFKNEENLKYYFNQE